MAESTEQRQSRWITPAVTVSDESDADVWFHSGPIGGEQFRILHDWCCRNPIRKNAFLILSTYGGDPHVAYRIGRCLQKHYGHVAICVNGPCVSAGTLLALAGHEIVMTDVGMLGPLNVRFATEGEVIESASELTTMQAVAKLTSLASSTFDEFLMSLKAKGGWRIELEAAVETAAQLTAKMYEPLFGQIDPLRLADEQRSLAMASAYGERLAEGSQNLRPGALQELVSGYPSHQFAIDREEAGEKLFLRVRHPSDAERELLDVLREIHAEPSRTTLLRCLSTQSRPAKEDTNDQATHHRRDRPRLHPQDHRATQDRVQADGKGRDSSAADSGAGHDETVH